MKRWATMTVLALGAWTMDGAVAQTRTLLQPQAQPSSQTQPPTQTQVSRDIDPNTLANAVLQALQMIDRDQSAALWDGASYVARNAARREDFIASIARTRKPLGLPIERRWMSVRREQVTGGGQMPPGTYVSVEFSSRFQEGRMAKELASLRQDEDGVWRFTGYVITQ